MVDFVFKYSEILKKTVYDRGKTHLKKMIDSGRLYEVFTARGYKCFYKQIVSTGTS